MLSKKARYRARLCKDDARPHTLARPLAHCADFSKLSTALHGLSVGHSCLSVLSNFYGELPTVKILE